jgi:hypothetical protein
VSPSFAPRALFAISTATALFAGAGACKPRTKESASAAGVKGAGKSLFVVYAKTSDGASISKYECTDAAAIAEAAAKCDQVATDPVAAYAERLRPLLAGKEITGDEAVRQMGGILAPSSLSDGSLYSQLDKAFSKPPRAAEGAAATVTYFGSPTGTP